MLINETAIYLDDFDTSLIISVGSRIGVRVSDYVGVICSTDFHVNIFDRASTVKMSGTISARTVPRSPRMGIADTSVMNDV